MATRNGQNNAGSCAVNSIKMRIAGAISVKSGTHVTPTNFSLDQLVRLATKQGLSIMVEVKR